VSPGFSRLTDLLSEDVQEISVNRDNLIEEMLQMYTTDPMLDARQIRVCFFGETGDDLGGLTKDLFTSLSLWSDILKNSSLVKTHL